MDSPAQPHDVLRFGPFELDAAAGELREAETSRRLTAQPFRVLVLLTDRAGELVTRQEIQRCLWGDRKYVEVDRGINFCMNQIRAALRDPAEDSRYIKTLPRRGYRFVAPITRVPCTEHREPFIASRSADVGSQSQLAGPKESPPLDQTAGGDSSRGLSAVRRSKRFGIAAIFLVALIAIPIGEPRLSADRIATLTAKDTIVVADFVNTTGEAVFDDTLTQALAIELKQSPFLNVLPDTRVRETLRMMELPDGRRVTPEIARELCLRTGSAAALEGRIASIGQHYLVGINATACGTGDELASEHGEAARKEEVLTALSQTASRLRSALGESLSSVQKFDAPASVTTMSLEALKSYSVGLRVSLIQGDAPGIPFLKRALELDPRFALAYTRLAGAYSNLDEPSAALEYETEAYALRNGVTEPERLMIEALYYRLTGELEKSTQTLEMWKSEYPRDAFPHGSLGANYTYMGQYAKAAAEWEEALRLRPDSVFTYENLASIYLALNETDLAQSIVQSCLARHLDSGRLRQTLYSLAFLRRDRVEMDRQAEWAANKPGAEDFLLSAQSNTEAYFGRVKNARRFWRRAVDSATRADLREAAALWQVIGSLTEAEFGERRVAVSDVREAMALAAGRNVKVLGALALARAGDTARAEAIAAELATDNSENTVLILYRLPSIEAAIALAHGNPRRALELLETTRSVELGEPTPAGLAPLYPLYLRGQAYLSLRDGPAAAVEFQKILDHPGIALNGPLGALALLQRARAAALTRDLPAARSDYRAFLTLWKEADTDIPVFIAAKSELARLH
jgi:DNA-binding winged helix-turn-helix (wHTH) protein/tetratricopeptide (TPR) repeat protein